WMWSNWCGPGCSACWRRVDGGAAVADRALIGVLRIPQEGAAVVGEADGGPVAALVQGRWLASVVRGHVNYYAVPGNSQAVAAFRTQLTGRWYKALRRRSHKAGVNWTRMNRIQKRWLPPARVTHPHPEVRFAAMHPR